MEGPGEVGGRDPPIGRPLPRLNEARLARRILLHLVNQPRLGPDDIPTIAFTQAGLADAIVATQGAVAKITRRLVAAGVLAQERRHVQGEPRRLQVYTLTWKGENLALSLESKSPKGPTSPMRSASVSTTLGRPASPR